MILGVARRGSIQLPKKRRKKNKKRRGIISYFFGSKIRVVVLPLLYPGPSFCCSLRGLFRYIQYYNSVFPFFISSSPSSSSSPVLTLGMHDPSPLLTGIVSINLSSYLFALPNSFSTLVIFRRISIHSRFRVHCYVYYLLGFLPYLVGYFLSWYTSSVAAETWMLYLKKRKNNSSLYG